MSLSNPKTITEVFGAHGVTSGQVCVLLECQELALAVTLQGKYNVDFSVGIHGIRCGTWLKGATPKNGNFRVTQSENDLENIGQVAAHLRERLADSASDGGNAQ